MCSTGGVAWLRGVEPDTDRVSIVVPTQPSSLVQREATEVPSQPPQAVTMSTRKREKFVISSYKQPAQMDNKTAQRVWGSLRSAISQIHNQDASLLSFEELYRFAYNLVLHQHGELLYNGVHAEVKGHLKKVASVVDSQPNETLLEVLSAKWNLHKVTMVMIRDILMYMDRIYVVKNKKDKVYEFGLKLFRDVVVRQPTVKPRLKRLLLDNIRRERNGEVIDKGLMKNTLTMLVDLGIQTHAVYNEDFEKAFLEETFAFYREEAQRFIAENTCPVFLFKAEARIQQERARVADYLSSTTGKRLNQIVEQHLICTHAQTLVEMSNSGLVAMLRDNKVDDLNRMYRLFAGPGKLDLLWRTMAAHVVQEGEALVKDAERSKVPVEFVKKLLEMRDKYDNIVRVAFTGDKQFQRSLKNSFEKFMNMDTRCAQFLSVYVDDLLRHRIRGMGDGEIDRTLDKVIVIFRYLQDKDIFETYYKSHLQKRLLGGKSLSDDWERTMIAKLKTECGFQFTSKLEGMFQDMRISKDINEKYRRAKAGTPGLTRTLITPNPKGAGAGAGAGEGKQPELNVTVLTTGFWPAQAVAPCRLPACIAAPSDAFKAYYLQLHSGRRLTWQTNRGQADIRANYGAKRWHELTVSTYQMCILLLFNTADKLTYNDIRTATDIPDAECKRHLISLCTPRNRILLKLVKGKDVAATDEFQYNPKFSSKLRRVKVPLISTKGKGSSKAKSGTGAKAGGDGAGARPRGVPEPVEESRRHLIEAAVVRIMKTRRKLDNSNLVAEVTKQLSSRFRPTPQLIKKRIESLIEREYLERSEEDRRVYKYVA